VLLTLPASYLVWSRVYFYAIIGTAISTVFFASPAKGILKKKLELRAQKAGSQLKQSYSQESLAGRDPVMGLPPDGLDETIKEIKAEIEAKQRKGVHRNDTI
jgi:lysophospholipid acyltransferase